MNHAGAIRGTDYITVYVRMSELLQITIHLVSISFAYLSFLAFDGPSIVYLSFLNRNGAP